MINFAYTDVCIDDVLFLYEMLKTRNFNISHNQLPDFKTHLDFVLNNPYREWFIVRVGDIAIGNLYITYENSIGLHLCKQYDHLYSEIIRDVITKHVPLSAIKSIRPSYFYANIGINHKSRIKDLKLNGFIPFQISFKL